MGEDQITRRKFVQDTTATAAAMALATSVVGAADSQPRIKTRSYNENMEYRPLGKTGLMISAISLGGHWKKLPYQFGTDDFAKNRREVVSACIDCGINYIDACAGDEILAYAQALRGRRDKMFLGFSYYEHEMRFPDWRTSKKLLESLDDMMHRAKLECVDLWRVTCYWQDKNDHAVADEEGMVAALEKAQKAGKIRAGGMSTHKHAWTIRMIETYPKQIEAVVVPYTAGSKKAHARVDHIKGKGWKPVEEKRDPKGINIHSLIDAVKKNNVGWIGIKPFASGSVFKSLGVPDSATKKEDDERARMTLRYVLANDALTTTIPGLITIDQVKNAAKAIGERRKLDLAEARRLRQAVNEMWANLPEDYGWLKTDWEYV